MMNIKSSQRALAWTSVASLCCALTQTIQAQNNTQSTSWGSIPTHVDGDGGGGFNFNNGPVLGGSWDDFADFGDLAFTAVFNNTTISTVSSWDGANDISPFGSPPGNTETYGQTFVDPNGATTLDSFTFYVTDNGDGANLPYQGLVTDWSGSLVGGNGAAAPANILFASDTNTYVGDGAFEAITVNIPNGGLSLTPGDDYFMGLSSLPNGAALPEVGPGSAVPDGGSSLLLLGLSFGGISALRRRFSII